MSPRRLWPVEGGAPRAALALALALSVATCRDALGPRTPTRARIDVAPVLPSAAALAEFGLTIDAVRFVVVRPPSDTLADTTLALPPDSSELTLDLRVSLVTSPETLSVSVLALSGTIPLFSGTRPVPVPSPLPPTEIPVDTYVGPPADSVVIQPRSPFILLNDSLRFQVQGFNQGVPVTQFYIAWSSSDSALASINRFGVLRAPAARAAVRVHARTPSGASDSVLATFVPPATQLVAVAGGGQADTVGTPLPTPLEVQARAADGLGVGGVTVRFRSLTGGGTVTDSVVVTDSGGRARTTVTLGSILGVQGFEASATGLGGSPVGFNAVAFAGRATQLVATAGDLQSAIVGAAVATDPAVRAEDQFGNPVPGASITFAVSGSGGSVTGPAQLTNGSGVAAVGSWTLDTTAGPNALTATLAGVTPVTFTATGIAGAATKILKLAGDSQTAVVNTVVPTAPQVRIEDQFGNPVAGVVVGAAVDSGSGAITNPSPVSDSAGVASVGSWRLDTLVGQNALTVSASGLAGSPVSFTATGLVGAVSQMVAFAGDSQAALVGTAVSIAPAVRVSDQFGNAVGGVAVTFTIGLGGGTVGLPATVSSDTAGIAVSSGWTLGTVGLNTLDATATGLPMVTFTAEALSSNASTIESFAGNGQTDTVEAVLLPYSARVLDAAGSPVGGVPVSWAVGLGGGTIAPAQSITNALGIATATRTLGPIASTQTATASVGGLTGSPVTFSATALPVAPARFLKQSVDPQDGTVATPVVAPAVKVIDRLGNAVAGVVVNFAVTAGGGIVGASADTTDPQGLATAGSWTLGSVAGTNTVTVSSVPLSNVVFTATGLAGAPTQLAFLTEPARALAGDTIEPAVRVAVRDQFGNVDFTANNGVMLQLGPTPPDPAAKLLGTTDTAAINGVAVFPGLAIDSAGIGYTLVATALNLAGVESKPFDIGGVIGAVTSDRLDPVAAAFSPGTGFVFVPGVNNTISVFDPGKGQITQFPILQNQPFGVAVNAPANRVYITTFATLVGAVIVLDDRDPSAIVATIPILTGEPRGIAVDEATDRIFVAVGGDPGKEIPPSLAIIDGVDNRVVTSIPFRDGALAGIGVAFNPKDGFVYVAIPNLGVGVFDLAKGEHVTTVPIAGEKGAAGTFGVAVDVRANLVYATNRTDGTFSAIDPVGLKEIAKLRVGALPEGLGVDPDRGMAYVGNSGGNTVSFIDAGKLSVFATLIVGPAPKAVAVNPLNGQFFVPTFGDDMVRVIQP